MSPFANTMFVSPASLPTLSLPGQQITFQLAQSIEVPASIMAVPGLAVVAHGGLC